MLQERIAVLVSVLQEIPAEELRKLLSADIKKRG